MLIWTHHRATSTKRQDLGETREDLDGAPRKKSSPIISFSCSQVFSRGYASSSAFVGIPSISGGGGCNVGPGILLSVDGDYARLYATCDNEKEETILGESFPILVWIPGVRMSQYQWMAPAIGGQIVRSSQRLLATTLFKFPLSFLYPLEAFSNSVLRRPATCNARDTEL